MIDKNKIFEEYKAYVIETMQENRDDELGCYSMIEMDNFELIELEDDEYAISFRVTCYDGNYMIVYIGEAGGSYFSLNEKYTFDVNLKTFELDNGAIIKQIPVTLAYAITVNKAQGATFDSVNIIPGFFETGQLYTAISRCKSLEGVHIIGNIQYNELIVDEKALSMMTDSE